MAKTDLNQTAADQRVITDNSDFMREVVNRVPVGRLPAGAKTPPITSAESSGSARRVG